MPDAIVFCQAVAAAGGAAGLAALAIVFLARRDGRLPETLLLAAYIGGAVAGFAVLQIRPTWPPANGLDRFLAIVLPCTLAVEAAAILVRLPQWCGWLMRIGLAAVTGRVLLHDSVYLSGSDDSPALWQTWALLLAGGALLTFVWGSLTFLKQRRADNSTIAVALAMTIVTGGLAVMLAGYIKGGAAALPLAASLVGVTLAARLTHRQHCLPATLSLAIVALFCLLFIGVFFGRLSGGRAVVILLAPLAVGLAELPPLRRQGAWIAAALGLLLVATVLAAVLVLAKLDFDRKLAPLLSNGFDHPASGLTHEQTT